MKIIWSSLALERMAEISGYIAEDSPVAANGWIDRIFTEIDLLKTNHKLGRVVPELEIPDIRELTSGNYRIIYRIERPRLSILTVRNFKQFLPESDIQKSSDNSCRH